MARKQSGELHKVTVVQVGINLIRVCVNCGASWQLMTLGTLDTPRLAWKPIAEVDADGRDIRFGVDITECDHMDDAHTTQPVGPAARGLAAVDAASRRGSGDVKSVCYCDVCKGKGQHWADDDRCFCKSCKGRKSHYAA